MALPKPVRPEYNLTIPSTGKRIKFMPFSVREEKILILAAESQDADEIANAIRNTLERCVTTPGFKVDELALFDIEYLFLKCRAKSAGETIKVVVQDPNDEEFRTEHEINIDSIKVKKNKDHKDLIEVDPHTTVKMRYPGIAFFEEGIDAASVESMSNALQKCISQIIIDEEVHSKADMSDEEVDEWVEGLTQAQYRNLVEFFNTMPRLTHTFKIQNTRLDTEFSITLEGLADFF
jgi:hypothetical protein